MIYPSPVFFCTGIGWVWLAGTAAGIPAAFLTTPIDVIKTRVQAPRPGSSAEHLTARQHLTQLLEEPGGWHRLLAGAGPRVLRSAPQFGVTLVVYEMINKSMGW